MLHGRSAETVRRTLPAPPIIIGLTMILTLGVLASPAQATGSEHGWPGPPAGPADWPQAMRGSHHQGVNRVETVLTRETVGHLVVAWTKRTGYGPAPSVVGDVAFLGGTAVVARRVDTGARLWRTNIGGDVGFTPAYGHGIVVAVAYKYDRGETVSGLDASSGALLWTRPIRGDVYTPPSISGGTVYIGYSKAMGYGVAALKLRSGGIRWRWTTPDPTAYAVSSPTTDGTSVYFSLDGGGRVVSLDAATGAVRWDEVLDSEEGGAAPMVSLQGDTLFTGDVARNLYALDSATGAVIWQKSLQGGVWVPTTTTPRRLFVILSGETLLALSTADGSTRWTYQSPSMMSPGVSVAGGVIYFGSRNTRMLALDTRTGAVLYDLGEGDHTAPPIPTVSNGRVLLSQGGSLLMLTLPASRASRPVRRVGRR